MSDPTHDATIDWTEYWTDAGEENHRGAGPAGRYTLEPLRSVLEDRGPPDSLADAGCGPGHVPLTVAADYPDASVVGYDAAEPVLDANRDRADERGLENVAFERAVLPEFDPGRRFEAVSCFHTLVYVEAVERALSALYDAVEPGGVLVFTYHNRLARSVFESIAAAPHEHLGPDSPWDPDRFADRFELLLEGANLLSYERIHETLGRRPRSVWSVASDLERYGAWRQNPLVYVPKP